MCFRFRRSMEADVLTSVFMSMATAPMPTIVTTKFDIAMCVCVSGANRVPVLGQGRVRRVGTDVESCREL